MINLRFIPLFILFFSASSFSEVRWRSLITGASFVTVDEACGLSGATTAHSHDDIYSCFFEGKFSGRVLRVGECDAPEVKDFETGLCGFNPTSCPDSCPAPSPESCKPPDYFRSDEIGPRCITGDAEANEDGNPCQPGDVGAIVGGVRSCYNPNTTEVQPPPYAEPIVEGPPRPLPNREVVTDDDGNTTETNVTSTSETTVQPDGTTVTTTTTVKEETTTNSSNSTSTTTTTTTVINNATGEISSTSTTSSTPPSTDNSGCDTSTDYCGRGLGGTDNYQSSELTYSVVLSEFGDKVKNAQVIQGLDNFFAYSPSGDCPVFSAHIDYIGFDMKFDQLCSNLIPWTLIKGAFIAAALFFAARISFT